MCSHTISQWKLSNILFVCHVYLIRGRQGKETTSDWQMRILISQRQCSKYGFLQKNIVVYHGQTKNNLMSMKIWQKFVWETMCFCLRFTLFKKKESSVARLKVEFIVFCPYVFLTTHCKFRYRSFLECTLRMLVVSTACHGLRGIISYLYSVLITAPVRGP